MANFLDINGLSHLKDKLDAIFQRKLVSGTSIKTINNTSLLGSGNLSISGLPDGGSSTNMLVKNSSTSGDASWKPVQPIYTSNSEGSTPASIDADLLGGKSLTALLNILYPVGSIYTTTSETNPSVTLGIGTWVKIATKMPIGENVFGNGKGLAISNGTKLYGIDSRTGLSGRPLVLDNTFGKSMGDSQVTADVNTDKVLGVPTKTQLGNNPENSGLCMDSITVNMWQRSA